MYRLTRKKPRVDDLESHIAQIARQDSLDAIRLSSRAAGLEEATFSLEDDAFARRLFISPSQTVAAVFAVYCRNQAVPNEFDATFTARGCYAAVPPHQPARELGEIWLESAESLLEQVHEAWPLDLPDEAASPGVGAASGAASADLVPAARSNAPTLLIHVICRVRSFSGVDAARLAAMPSKLALHAYFLHARRQFVQGSLDLVAIDDESLVLRLIALLLQAALGDCRPDSAESLDFSPFLPPLVLTWGSGTNGPGSPGSLAAHMSPARRSALFAAYADLGGCERTVAEQRYLQLTSDLPGFGSFVFGVEVEHAGRAPYPAIVSIDLRGNFGVQPRVADVPATLHASERVLYWSVAGSAVEIEIEGVGILTIHFGSGLEALLLASVLSSKHKSDSD